MTVNYKMRIRFIILRNKIEGGLVGLNCWIKVFYQSFLLTSKSEEIIDQIGNEKLFKFSLMCVEV